MLVQTMKFLLTKSGKDKVQTLLFQGKKPKLLIMVGSAHKKATVDDIKLQQEEDEAKVTMLFPSDQDNKNITKLHIQGNLPVDSKEYDIHEIGLFISDENKLDKTLLAIFSKEEIIARKTAGIELFLNIIIDLSNYTADQFTIDTSNDKPTFQMRDASEKLSGIVQLATEASIRKGKNNLNYALTTSNLAGDGEVQNKTAGFVLTTNNIEALVEAYKVPKASEDKLGIVQLSRVDNIKEGKNTLNYALTTSNLAGDREVRNKTAGFVLTTNNIEALGKSYEIPKASEEKLGTVQLAKVDNIKEGKNTLNYALTTSNLAGESEIKSKKAGFILTTNNIKELIKSYKAPVATTDTQGTVQLATEATIKEGKNTLNHALTTSNLAGKSEVEAKKPGFVLTTTIIDHLFSDRFFTEGNWSKLSSFNLKKGEDIEDINEIVFAKAIYESINGDVYFIFAAKFSKDSKLYFYKYNLAKGNFSLYESSEFENKAKEVMPKNFFGSDPAVELSFLKDSIRWLFSSFENNERISYEFNLEFSKKKFNLKKMDFPLDGSLFFYNGKTLSLAEIDKESKKIFMGAKFKNENFEKKDCLVHPRKRPLVHVVGDKIYCLGGQKEASKTASLVEIISILSLEEQKYSISSFIPERNINNEYIEISKTNDLTSCLLDSWIYILNWNKSLENFYRFNTFDNQWQRLTIGSEVKNYLEKNKDVVRKVFFVAAENNICLFAISKDWTISVFKFTPPNYSV